MGNIEIWKINGTIRGKETEKKNRPGGAAAPPDPPASRGAAPPGPPAIYEGLRPSNSPIFMEYGMLTQTFCIFDVKPSAKF